MDDIRQVLFESVGRPPSGQAVRRPVPVDAHEPPGAIRPDTRSPGV